MMCHVNTLKDHSTFYLVILSDLVAIILKINDGHVRSLDHPVRITTGSVRTVSR